MPSKKYILFADLETTGNKPDSDILEVGLALTDRNLDVIATYSETYRPETTDLWSLDPTVIEMHSKSGLWRDIMQDDPRDAWTNYEMLDLDIIAWLDRHTDNEAQHIPFAGSGVGHFDRQYIRKYLPRLDKRLTYWPLDVGVFRRLLELFGVSPDFLTMYVEQKPHRALHDALLAVAELRSYMAVERRQSGLNPPILWQHPVPLIDNEP